jgi:hypothetical protein
VARRVAALRGVAAEEIGRLCIANFRRFLGRAEV